MIEVLEALLFIYTGNAKRSIIYRNLLKISSHTENHRNGEVL